ncbi:MAG: type II toxin-antitoxin system death-on-curing family toxin [Parvibaculum sp.]|nr:type II toxin-antitoxin system death-on-curing family toxin [Parvibaculum sp.]
MTDYLTMVEALAMHEELIELYGGAQGVRDMGALESALFRPQTGYYDDVIAEAAALLESLAVNHPFIDGNKRIAFAVADVFLRLNGFVFEGDPVEAYDFMIGLFDAGTFRYEQLEPWLRANVRAL